MMDQLWLDSELDVYFWSFFKKFFGESVHYLKIIFRQLMIMFLLWHIDIIFVN